jgi:hypothetical protein
MNLIIVMYHEDQTEMLLTEEEVKKARDASYESERLKEYFFKCSVTRT